ncbi:hypothetical protein T484DRAFT_1757150 [Baffinella frigidus]|nr:hypothetical protein T484DRAFT_1757150 [Cryptophyta sp. CCMP2293]
MEYFSRSPIFLQYMSQKSVRANEAREKNAPQDRETAKQLAYMKHEESLEDPEVRHRRWRHIGYYESDMFELEINRVRDKRIADMKSSEEDILSSLFHRWECTGGLDVARKHAYEAAAARKHAYEAEVARKHAYEAEVARKPSLEDALKRNDFGYVRAFVGSGGNVDAIFENGNTALHEAVARTLLSFVRALMAEGADPNIPNANGKSPRELLRSDVWCYDKLYNLLS